MKQDKQQANPRQKRLKDIKCVTKKRILNMFDEEAITFMAQQGPQWMVRSDVERFEIGPMHGNIPTELVQMENIGPGKYRHPDVQVPGIHLSTINRFKIDAMTADVRTEMQLPGTENIGPGYYRNHFNGNGNRLPSTNPAKEMSSKVIRFQDPRNPTTECQRNSLTGPGYIFVPQDHLFWAEDGSCKLSENTAINFPKDERFQMPPEMREKQQWARQQAPLDAQEEWWRKETWNSNAQPLATGPRMMGHSPLDVTHSLPLDAHKQGVPLVGHTQSPEMRHLLAKKTSQWLTHRKSLQKHATAVSTRPKGTKSRPSTNDASGSTGSLHHFTSKVRCQSPAATAEPQTSVCHAGTPARIRAQQSMSRPHQASNKSPKRSRTAAGVVRGEAPDINSSATPGLNSQSQVPRCAKQIYSRRVDRSPVPLSDGFLPGRAAMQHTLQYKTGAKDEDCKAPFSSKVSKEIEKCDLWNHQPNIITNTNVLGPGTYFGSDRFGAGDSHEIEKARTQQEHQWNEFQTGCPQHNLELNLKAQELISRHHGSRVLAFD